ncbi:MAG: hypothetical protein PHN88_14740 [Ignavibacteria bacterium]|nr:hypothetical protein [Ignavibacteria bacterium]
MNGGIWLMPDRLDEIQKAMLSRARVRFGPIYPITRFENDFTRNDKNEYVLWFNTEDGSSHALEQIADDTPKAVAVKE